MYKLFTNLSCQAPPWASWADAHPHHPYDLLHSAGDKDKDNDKNKDENENKDKDKDKNKNKDADKYKDKDKIALLSWGFIITLTTDCLVGDVFAFVHKKQEVKSSRPWKVLKK